jgi:hypothetical protein
MGNNTHGCHNDCALLCKQLQLVLTARARRCRISLLRVEIVLCKGDEHIQDFQQVRCGNPPGKLVGWHLPPSQQPAPECQEFAG